MPYNSNIRGNLYSYLEIFDSGAQISADLQPFGGINNLGAPNDSPTYSVQVVVNALGSATTFVDIEFIQTAKR